MILASIRKNNMIHQSALKLVFFLKKMLSIFEFHWLCSLFIDLIVLLVIIWTGIHFS